MSFMWYIYIYINYIFYIYIYIYMYIYTKNTLLNLYYERKTNTTNILLAKSAKTTLCYPFTDFYFETVEGIGFFYHFRNNFPNFRS